MKKLLATVGLVGLLSASTAQAQEKEIPTIEVPIADMEVACKSEKASKFKEVYLIERRDEGHIYHRFHCKNGVPEGKQTVYHADGSILTEVTYKDGKRKGRQIANHENGKMASSVKYDDQGQRTGTRLTWDQEGRPDGISCFKNGKRQGVALNWRKGEIRDLVTYKNDSLHGLMYHFTEGQIDEVHFNGSYIRNRKLQQNMNKQTLKTHQKRADKLITKAKRIFQNKGADLTKCLEEGQ